MDKVIYTDNELLTADEQRLLYGILWKQCEEICPHNDSVPEYLWESILAVTDIFCLTPTLFDVFEPERAVEILRSLQTKGFVFVYDVNNRLSFVPLGWHQTVKTTYTYTTPTKGLQV